MKDDEKKRLLVRAGRLADHVASEHSERCPVGQFARAVGGEIRRAIASAGGPAQMATPAYRENWTTIFGKKSVVGQA